jgi:thermitase
MRHFCRSLAIAVVCLLPVSALAQASGESKRIAAHQAPHFRDEVVLVGFEAISQERQAAIVASVGARDLRTIGAGTHVLQVPPGRVLDRVEALKKTPGVRYAEPDWMQHVDGGGVPSDPSYPVQWALQNTGQTVNGVTGVAGADERALAAWATTTGSTSFVIAVTDTGIDYTHPDLAANVWSAPSSFTVSINGTNFTCPAGSHGFNVLGQVGTSTGQQCNPMDDDTSYNGHGTHVSGIIGAVGNNGTGVAGVNWIASLMGVKWVDSTGSGATSDLITGLQGVVTLKQGGVNIRIVNDSQTWAGTAFSQALSDEIDVLGANDILFVAASGNTAENNDTTPRYPCVYDRPNEICAAASDQTDHLWSSANRGATTVQLAAPGVNIYSTLRNGRYGYISGGSMAAAETSGAAALVLATSNLNTTDLRSAILSHVDVLPSLAGLVSTGGRLNICSAIIGCGAPTNTALPTISGTATQGQTLTTSNGTWTNNPTTFQYRWNRCNSSGASCSQISGASGQNYLLVAADVGFTLRAAVTAKNSVGSASATSTQTAVVQASSGGSGIALVQSGSVQGSASKSISKAFGRANTAGNLIIAFVRMSTTTQTVTVKDSLGNTYADAVSQTQTTDGSQIHLFYAKSIKAGANTVTATLSGSNSHPWLAIYEYSGLSTSAPLDKTAHGQGTSASPNSGATGTVSAATELVFAGLGLPSTSGATVTAGSGYHLEQQTTSTSRAANEDRLTTSTGSYSGTFALSGSTNWSAVVATFAATAVVPPPPAITTTSLANGTFGTSYSQTVAATGGTTPYSWSVVTGSLPAGLSLNASTGAITGTPTASGTSSFTVQVADSSSPQQTASKSLSITVSATALSITTTSLPNGTVSTPYDQSVAASGGTAPYTWSVSVGALPAALSLNVSTGAISGTPTTAGTSNFTVQVADSSAPQQIVSKALSITINAVTSNNIALKQSASVQGSSLTSLSQSFPVSNTAGNLIIVFVRMSTTTQTVSLTDTNGNSYVDAVSQEQSTDGHQVHILYAQSVNGGANTVTATFSASNAHPFLAVYEYSGLSTTAPLDQTAKAQGSTTAVSSGSTATTTAANELIFSGLGLQASSTVTFTPGSGFTLQQLNTLSPGSRAGSEDEEVISSGIFAGTYTLSGSAYWTSVVATFK